MAEVKNLPVNYSIDSMSRRLENLEKRHNGGGGGMVDERVAKLETIADFMRQDMADIKKDLRESRAEIKQEFREIRNEMRQDNKATRTTMIITGISVVLGIGAIIGGMLYSIAQIQTSWLTSVAQILQK